MLRLVAQQSRGLLRSSAFTNVAPLSMRYASTSSHSPKSHSDSHHSSHADPHHHETPFDYHHTRDGKDPNAHLHAHADAHHHDAHGHAATATAGHHDAHHGDAHHGAAGHDAHHEDAHHHGEEYGEPHGYLFGEVYEGKRKIKDWEWIYYIGMGASTLLAIYVYNYHSDKWPHVIAEKEYLRRQKEKEAAE